MKAAYVDTSCLVAIAFGERVGAALDRRLAGFDVLVASNLVEAELRATFVREGVEEEPMLLEALSWILPERPLQEEIVRVLQTGYVRGADCWHLATALYLAEDPGSLSFMTLDTHQREAAAALGFNVK